jgi:ATP-dependent helicase/nuclease subunit A
MSAAFMKQAELSARAAAVDPGLSAFVSANAGSGKTTILTNRILRMLLAKTDPSQILALTYTKAAAAEMQKRVFDELGSWVSLPDEALDQKITSLGARPPDAEGRRAARRLFAQALETPGGLKIQTIHAFCESLLHLFPFEANVPARFRVLEEAETKALLKETLDQVVIGATAGQDALLRKALGLIASSGDPDSLAKQIATALGRHGDAVFSTAAAIRNNATGTAPLLRLALKIGLSEKREDIEREIVHGGIPPGEWAGIVKSFNAGSPNDQKFAAALRSADFSSGAQRAANYMDVFLTGDRKPLVSVGTGQIEPALKARMAAERDRIAPLVERHAALDYAERTEALCLLAAETRRLFQSRKADLGALDFDDLIARTEILFQRAEAQWVLYKLDARIAHVLIDEAQDTARRQWSILMKLTDDFFSGAGQAGRKRTVFAVGDEKQSIFSFQGASPAAFGAAKDHFRRKTAAAELEFKSLDLQVSFRTTPDILAAVDAIFSDPGHRRGLSLEDLKPVHESMRPGEAGFVEIWPAIAPPEKEDRDAFDAPDEPAQNAPAVLLARRISRRIALWMAEGHYENDGKPIRPGDIMILVRKRNAVFSALLRELKRAGVPVAGADRLRLSDHIAVEDLFALAEAMLNKQNDLALACLLKSPLIGLDDNDLIALTEAKEPLSLAERLEAAQEERFVTTAATLRRWRKLAIEADPFSFFAGILSVEGGRRALLARLGPDAAEAIDVFLADVMTWQRQNPPSLALFAATMRAADREVKRDLSKAGDAVRLMTVHGAKGLEARIVILADTFSAPRPQSDPELVTLRPAKDVSPPVICFGKGPKPVPAAITAAKQAERDLIDDEYRRLLYVALTRARDRLYITGFSGKTTLDTAWYKLIEQSLSARGELIEIAAEDGEGMVRRFSLRSRPAAPPQRTELAIDREPALPDWWSKPAPLSIPKRPPLRPSGLIDAADELETMADGNETAEARLRGSLIHVLLERLPALPSPMKQGAAQTAGNSFLQSRNVAPDLAASILKDVLAVVEAPDFAFLFGKHSRAEAAIAGAIRFADGSQRFVRGRIDRLAVGPKRILCVDYKTGRPRALPDKAMLFQLALYRALLMQIYPGRRIDAGILWTSLPKLRIIPAETLDAALPAIAAL